ncbi:MAG: T9SS type A sorting domain-containing protein [Lentimicrobium sp.]|nr:T9SS type A sorting domain-containing protein [Lentimicrobium sp.]
MKFKMQWKGLPVFLAMAMTLFVSVFARGNTSGDYRTAAAAVNWNVIDNWQVWDGDKWVAATVVPGPDNDVYVQSGHVATLTANGSCKSLFISTGTTSATTGDDAQVALASNTLEISGKLSCYYGLVDVVVGSTSSVFTDKSDNVTGSFIVKTPGSEGRIKFIGNSRSILVPGEWKASSAASPETFAIEIALNSGQTATMETSLKASSWLISSGKLYVGDNSISVDNGTAGTGDVTISIGAIIESLVSGSSNAVFRRTSSSYGGALIVNGKLILAGTSPNIAMNEVFFNGEVEYSKTAYQTLAVFPGGATGTSIGQYHSLILSGSGNKTLGLSTVVASELVTGGGTTLVIPSSMSLTVGSSCRANINGSLTNSAGSAGLVLENGASFIHDVNSVQATAHCVIPGTTNNWHLLASPVANQAIADNFIPTGTSYDFYAWDEPSEMWLNQKVTANNLTAFIPGSGYLVAYALPDTKSFTGGLNNGNITFNLKYSATGNYKGANLMGNPYPSGIDWHLANRGQFQDNFAYAYNPGKAGGEGYEAIDGALENAYIGCSQGFFVLAKQDQNNQPFTFTNAMRAHGGSFYKNTGFASQMVVRLSREANYDEAVIRLSDESEFERDRFDAVKMFSYNPAIPQVYAFTADRVQTSVNTVPSTGGELNFPIGLYIPEEGNYQIAVQALTGDWQNQTVFLEDKIAGSQLNLTAQQAYTFYATPADDANRFVLKFSSVGVDEPGAAALPFVYSAHGQICIALQQKSPAQVKVYSLTGQLVLQGKAAAETLTSINTGSLHSGIYIVAVNTGSQLSSHKVVVR